MSEEHDSPFVGVERELAALTAVMATVLEHTENATEIREALLAAQRTVKNDLEAAARRVKDAVDLSETRAIADRWSTANEIGAITEDEGAKGRAVTVAAQVTINRHLRALTIAVSIILVLRVADTVVSLWPYLSGRLWP